MFSCFFPRLLRKDITTPIFSLDKKILVCKVVDIYDGDTCKVVFKYKREYNKWTIRMYGYDSPEIKVSKKIKEREKIKQLGLNAREHLIELITKQKLLYIRCYHFEKYGRLLGELYYTKKDAKLKRNSINEKMIDSGHGVSYFGGTKINNSI